MSESWTHIKCKGNKRFGIPIAIQLVGFNNQFHMERVGAADMYHRDDGSLIRNWADFRDDTAKLIITIFKYVTLKHLECISIGFT